MVFPARMIKVFKPQTVPASARRNTHSGPGRLRLTACLALVLAGACFVPGGALARNQIKIAGSSTVYPYAQAVAEEFSERYRKKAPVLESTGTGGGMKIFCAGVGEAFIDITNASRAMKKSEWLLCNKNGVTAITEVLIGYDGLSLALAHDGADFDLTKTQLYLALAKKVPVDGKLVSNPYQRWNEIGKTLPDQPIRVYGPPPTSGTRDAFVELVLHTACKSAKKGFWHDKKQAMADKKEFKAYYKRHCTAMRTDGPFIEAGENDNLIVQRLGADSDALGIFGYSFLFENLDKLKAAKINGVSPDLQSIADGSYDVARPLFFYIKNAHRGVIDGLDEYIAEFVDDEAMGPDGYLSERGLVPLDDKKRKAVRDAAIKGTGMTRFAK